MILADVSVKRPVFTIVVMIAFVVVGILCYTNLTINDMPQVDLPYVTVTVTQGGASPNQLETNVTKKVEEAVGQISGVKHITSTMTEGVSNTTIEFSLDKSPDVAAQEVRDNIGAIRGELPKDIDDPIISKVDLSASPILSIAVSGTEETKELSQVVDDVIAKRLYTVKGVGAVNIHGDSKREIQIKLDQNKMAAYGLTVEEVINNLKSGNLEGTGGTVTDKSNEISLRIDGSVKKVEDFNNLLVAKRNGKEIRVHAIAEVIDGFKDADSLSMYQGKQAIGIDIVKQSGANTVEVADAVKKELSNLKAYIPRGVNVDIVRDNSESISDSVNEVMKSMLEGCILAIIVVFLFLNEWESTLISALSLPTSIISSFIALKVMNFSLNTMSLMALSLAIGLLIDDAIVVVENIVRHLHLGKTPFQAAKEATTEIGLAVLATTLAVVAVFLPTAMVNGIIGKFFIEFGLTVVFSMLFSLLVSFTLVPMMSSRILKTEKKHNKTFFGKSLNNFSRMFDKIAEKYSQFLSIVLHHRLITMVLATVLFAGCIGMISSLGIEFSSSTDNGEISINTGLDSGLSLEKAGQKARDIEGVIRQYSEVKSIYTTVQKEQASFFVKLSDKRERKDSAKIIASKMREDLKKIPGIELAINAVSNSGDIKDVVINIQGDNYDQLRRFALEAKRVMSQDPYARDVSISDKAGKPEAKLDIDRDKAADLGVDTSLAMGTLNTLFNGTIVGQYNSGKNKYDVRLSMEDQQRTSLDSLSGISVPGSNNQMVPLSQVTRKVLTTTPTALNRHDRTGQIEISANVSGMATGDFMNLYLKKFNHEMKVPAGITVEEGGMGADMQEGFIGLLIALGMGILFIFLIMAAQFESFIDPIAIMFSLPLALIGAIAALYATGSKIDFMALIGIIMLMGLVAKNAILLVDYAKQKLREGAGINKALIDAGRVRFRPILMTTLAMIFGMIPIATATGAGTEMRAPMAYAVIGGLISSTFLTLFIVPVVYSILNDFKVLFRKRMSVEANKQA
ncbi:efflux RND transporter permease subunit [Desulfosporosinus sp. PR]|uniref:efflux RND transporter permease subunit n=1 Tax=Candidatus Desulfosporosinus nitrosoreducens TaxID=3401928 RepID=UPI0027EE9313|nr:efflux RND transporter permease subunit [Desulfosporosinus sp. PR]MDQ7096547.1 efflux RND transporter permease subunit [Desulfosporosinus sp. PR]